MIAEQPTNSLEEIFSVRGDERVRDLGLSRVEAALEELGRPHQKLRTILIAGTNGKGTVSLLVSSALAAAGHRVATYLSPHLVSLRERFLENLEPIEESTLRELAKEVRPLVDTHRLTYFEYATVVFFLWAARREVAFAVVEVGMGGRLDATNVTDPVATILTNIALDHTETLGPDLPTILEEKLGVLRPEALLFTGIEQKELLDRVEHRCEEVDAVYYFSREVPVEVRSLDWEGQTISVGGHELRLQCPTTGAAKNASLALMCLRIVFPKIPMATLQQAFARVRNPCRFERIPGAQLRILSGDHNPAGVADLLSTLEKLPKKKWFILAGFAPDKPFEEMRAALARHAEMLCIVPVPGRGEPAAGYTDVPEYEADWREGWRKVCAAAEIHGDDAAVIVTGSLYLVGAVRASLELPVRFVTA